MSGDGGKGFEQMEVVKSRRDRDHGKDAHFTPGGAHPACQGDTVFKTLT